MDNNVEEGVQGLCLPCVIFFPGYLRSPVSNFHIE